MTDKTVAIEILKQLGGHKFIAMTGAKNFFATNNSMGFHIPGGGGRAKRGINFIKITLTSLDLYDMEFKRIRGTEITDIAKREGVYNDMLQDVFTNETGFAATL